MHQKVDKLTDTHPEFLAIRNTVSTSRRRFAGIILDMAFDHFLACNWDEWHDDDLRKFVDHCHKDLMTSAPILPTRPNQILNYMISQDWLYSYRKMQGISMAFNGLSRRFKFENPLAGSEVEIEQNYKLWQSAFNIILSDVSKKSFKHIDY